MQQLPHRGEPAGFMTLTYGLSKIDKKVLNDLTTALTSIGRKEGESDDAYNTRVMYGALPIITSNFYHTLPAIIAIDGQIKMEDLDKVGMKEAVDWIKNVFKDNQPNWTALQDFLTPDEAVKEKEV